MDGAGIAMQVLSAAGPGAELLAGADGVALAVDYNDRLAAAVGRHPDRFAGFAHLPMADGAAAADELERCVRRLGFVGALINGTTDGCFLDAPRYAPLLERAEALDVPIYIHPSVPPPAVYEAYYAGLPGGASFVLGTAGWGWHSETAIHLLRLVLSGALDRHPRLKIVVGHMGEMLPMMLVRLDDMFGRVPTANERPVSRTILDQVWITMSAIFSLPPFLAALTSFGADRILFSVDYPFADNARGTAFLRSLPVGPSELAKIAHENADALLKLHPDMAPVGGRCMVWEPVPEPVTETQ
jgi:predicted TIM-barrel fold metal-dependent hydrolase